MAAAAAVLSFFVFRPYLSGLFVALVFAVVFRPLHEAVFRKVKRAGISAFLTLVLLFLVILIPATLFGFFVFDDAQKLYLSARSGAPVFERFDALLRPVEESVQGIIPAFRLNVSSYVDAALSFFVGNFGSVFSRAVALVFQTFITLLALFFLFRDGKQLRAYLVSLSPLQNVYDERILRRVETAISSVVTGKLLIVFIQGVLASIGFALFSVPHPVLLGALISLVALIPAVGVALVFVPVVVYSFVASGIPLALGLLVFGVVIGAIDNVLGPVLFGKGLQMHPLFILLSVLGGLAFFGPVGFLAGPVTLALLFALLDIYPLLFQKDTPAV